MNQGTMEADVRKSLLSPVPKSPIQDGRASSVIIKVKAKF